MRLHTRQMYASAYRAHTRTRAQAHTSTAEKSRKGPVQARARAWANVEVTTCVTSTGEEVEEAPL